MTPEQKHNYLGKKGINCPVCGSTVIGGDGAPEFKADMLIHAVECFNCDSGWDDIYKLVDAKLIDEGPEVEDEN